MTGVVMAASAGGALGLVLLVWLASLRLRDASIIDVFWGVGFVVIAWICVAVGHGDGDRRLLLAALATIWGLRLAGHIGRRNLGKGEDRRYALMRERDGSRFWLTSLYRVYLVQAVAMWIVSLPLQAGAALGGGRDLGALDVIGGAVWLVGFAFEALGDLQLDRFKADPANRGRVMDRGLWRYSRHPNYFGDATAWWGLGLIALGAGGGAAWGFAGSILDTLLLTRVSGKPVLERDIEERRPGYRDYVERTSGFIPLPPRRRPSPS
jgi:steroid 5-alpha reductase family enzyme